MQLAMLLEAVAVVDETVKMLVEVLERRLRRDSLPGDIGRYAILPDLMDALDLAL